MKEIFKEEFNFAKIIIFKNYSNIEDRYNSSIKHAHHLYKKNHRDFFYSANLDSSYIDYNTSTTVEFENIELASISSKNSGEIFETTNDKHIKRHYNNPFADISIHKYERWIKIDGDKITIKSFFKIKKRGVNKIYFTKKIQSTTITFNISNGNFNVIIYNKSRKTNHKKFYVNSFISLHNALNKMYQPEQKFKNFVFNNENFCSMLINTICQEKCVKIDNQFESKFPIRKIDYPIEKFLYIWILKFIELKKIKMPDDGIMLLWTYYPTEKYLKKNDRKLISSTLDRFGIKSNTNIKLLHINPNLNMSLLVGMCNLFGNNYQKYISNIPDVFFSMINREFSNKNDILNNNHNLDLDNEEKENILKIVNSFDYRIDGNEFNYSSPSYNYRPMDFYTLLLDHFKMIKSIRTYYPEVKLRSKKFDTFMLEHTELSKISRLIRQEFSTHLIFNEEMINTIERPIVIESEEEDYENEIKEFIPKILKTSEDYFEEGSYMHHCVSSYIDSERSIIISLRHKEERVTCEFNIKTQKCLQARYFTNDPYPSHYISPLKELEKRISRLYGKLEPIEKIKKRLEINGKEIISDFVL